MYLNSSEGFGIISNEDWEVLNQENQTTDNLLGGFPMSIKFTYIDDSDFEEAKQWNPTDVDLSNTSVDTSKLDPTDWKQQIVTFRTRLDSSTPVDYLAEVHDQIFTIVLLHYDPLKAVREELNLKSVSFNKWLQENDGLPCEYVSKVQLFKDHLRFLSQKFDIDAERMVCEADIIVCCWGEFMECLYREKHLFKGNRCGLVYPKNYEREIFEVQSRPCYY